MWVSEATKACFFFFSETIVMLKKKRKIEWNIDSVDEKSLKKKKSVL